MLIAGFAPPGQLSLSSSNRSEGANYVHLGCYKDSDISNGYDLRGKEVTFETLSLVSCLEQCGQSGYPYAALQEGQKCFCGDTYGAYGLVTDAAKSCNYTCSGDSCGGHLANDIYYTVDLADDQENKRVLVYHDTQLQFVAARQQCIKSGGDLAMTLTVTSLNNTVYTALNANPDETSLWLGLRKKLDKQSTDYQWVDPSQTLYKSSSFSNRWNAGDSQNQDCVQITTSAQLWASASCDFQLRFVCWQLPLSDTNGGNGDGTTSDGSSGGFDNKMLSLYVVLPLFLFCYGGSCILYCSSKLYKNCKRQKRQKMLLANMESHGTEYEPETKPQAQIPAPQQQPPMGMPGLGPPPPPMMMNSNRGSKSPRPLSGNKNVKVSPAPMHDPMGPGSRPGMYPPGGPAAPQRAPYPPPPIPSTKPPNYSSPPGDIFTARSESRPVTSGGVEISMQETRKSASSTGRSSRTSILDGPPSSAKSRSKDEVKKAKLLDKALNEARERRRQEAIARGEDPDVRMSSRMQETALDGSTPSRSRDRKREAKYAMNEDSTNLLVDMETAESPPPLDGPPRDPTKMSIQDILKMKVAMNQQGRRKKIISA
ncbi:hypothetical protein CAPTEDRAFT_193207 [Capitella teleta]|uniref:WSC domain-containing protein n=1 Tax=Capitella teleta TaxID=283909 RepID=R7TDF3_CAPTE|nr:hypothetical protein CAPTEDRAFT_193207 [Capitella teleta]|eukprot:ELT91532.1 hypothetical protein CAPTEDRAFT_193207 [Capitella teleta]